MRPNQVKRVLHDLDNQTVRPTRVLLVDNSTHFINNKSYYYELEIIRPRKNIGTNPVWNLALLLKEDYCGILGDDYRLEPYMVEKLIWGLHIRHDKDTTAGATVPEIIQERRRGNHREHHSDIQSCRGRLLGTGKGQCSAVLMRQEVAHSIPPIPDHFNIFFGDNWISYHIIKMGLGFVRMTPCFIYHTPGANNVSASLNYKGTLKHERQFWNQFVREQASK
jgi:hypothetical protein